ncbi:MAG: hypothetical protein WKG01_24130 [Kofleriaceae bacterium]
MTAFLLVTAVWVSVAQIDIQPKGNARDAMPCTEGDPVCDQPKLSVLVETDEIWIGVSRLQEFQRIPRTIEHDWPRLETLLRAHKQSALFAESPDIEIAGLSTSATPIAYQEVVSAMDIAVKSGFSRPGLTDPAGLSAQPSL